MTTVAMEMVEGTADRVLLRDNVSEKGERSAKHKKTVDVHRGSDTAFLISALHMHGLQKCSQTRLRHVCACSVQHDVQTCSEMQ